MLALQHPPQPCVSQQVAAAVAKKRMRVLITGPSRGLGHAIALNLARTHREQASFALLSRSLTRPSHPSLDGNLLQLRRELIRDCGATAHAFEADLRDPVATHETVKQAIEALGGGLDLLVNNASALDLSHSPSPKRTSLVIDVNARGTLAVAHAAERALRSADGAMITLSPPIDLGRADFIGDHPHYTISKYAMTMVTLGFASRGVRAASLWPRQTAATAATARLETMVPGAFSKGRNPDDVAEAVRLLAAELQEGRRIGEAVFDDEVNLNMPHVDAPLDLFVQGRPRKD